MNRHIVVDDVTIVGAGSWHTIVKGREVALDPPAPDGSVHTGVGFYGAAEGGSANVHLSGSPSRATSANASTPTRSTASAAR